MASFTSKCHMGDWWIDGLCARVRVYVCIYDTAQPGLLTALLNNQHINNNTLYTYITTAEL